METGQYIKDGTVTWIITDIRDGNTAGHIRLEYDLLPGYIKANGATVKASDYPRLVAFVKAGANGTRVGYTLDETNDTLTVPDLRERFLQGGDSIALVEAGLPNIRGQFDARFSAAGITFFRNTFQNNAFFDDGNGVDSLGTSTTDRLWSNQPHIGFDASKSNPIYGASDTVQPPALTLIPQIKY